MTKLGYLKPRLGSLPGRFGGGTPRDEKQRSRQRRATQPWMKWYNTARWQRIREATLLRDRFTCQMQGCGKLETDTSKLVCDHITPHRGNETAFWAGPFQTLCQSCHNKRKQAEERSGIFF